jgi:hypothetical protein
MSTTNVIAEIIVTGFFSLIWILLLLLEVFGVNIALFYQNFLTFKDWSSVLLLVLFIITYQLGWLINVLGNLIIDVPFGYKFRNKVFRQKNLEYEKVRAAFYQHASIDLIKDLGLDRTVIRLARGGIINFSLISLTLIPFGKSFIILIILFLILAIGSFFQWRKRFQRYYKRLIISVEIIEAYKNKT